MHAAYWKEGRTASKAERERGLGSLQVRHLMTLRTTKRLFLKPLNNQIPCFPLINHPVFIEPFLGSTSSHLNSVNHLSPFPLDVFSVKNRVGHKAM